MIRRAIIGGLLAALLCGSASAATERGKVTNLPIPRFVSLKAEEGNVRRFEMTNLFPPYIPAMTNDRLHKADEYFSGQDLGALFQEVGPDVPAQYQSPYRAEMNATLNAEWQAIYDGDRYPGWEGSAFIGGLAGTTLARLTMDGLQVREEERLLSDWGQRIRDVRSAPDGYLYILTDVANGGLYRLEPAS